MLGAGGDDWSDVVFGDNSAVHVLMNASLRFLGLLDLPEHSSITIDGAPLVLRRSDFVGFVNLPITTDSEASFHFVAVQAASTQRRNVRDVRSHPCSITVGFVIPNRGPLIRRYDPITEEVSSEDVDPVTVQNLLTSVGRGRVDSQRVVDFEQLLDASKQRSWSDGTFLVSPRLLSRRGIGSGAKIVPGAFRDDDVDNTMDKMDVSEGTADGKPAAYPPIPVLHNFSNIQSSPSRLYRVRHAGTKRYLSRLDPASRTRLLVDPDNARSRVLEAVLRDYYDGCWQDLVGDVQLSYLLFLQLHCYASLTHWRDLLAMLSCVNSSRLVLDRSTVDSMFTCLLKTLSWQVMTMDEGMFDDMELSGDNVLIPALRRLVSSDEGLTGYGAEWQASRNGLQRILQQRFPSQFPPHREEPEVAIPFSVESDTDDDDDDDGPVVVEQDEVDASLARISREERSVLPPRSGAIKYPKILRDRYPVLFAAMGPNEDLVMVCARALDQANDVSLVREAADYLQNVEAAASPSTNESSSSR